MIIVIIMKNLLLNFIFAISVTLFSIQTIIFQFQRHQIRFFPDIEGQLNLINFIHKLVFI
jgi:hypothetical protein